MTEAQVIACARTYLGTPWQHQARRKGIAVDCIGLLVGAFSEAGYAINDVTDYGRNPNPRRLMEHINLYFQRLAPSGAELKAQADRDAWENAGVGDVLLFSFVGMDVPQHVGICTGKNVLHTYQGAGMVVEHAMTADWQRALHSVWRLREWQR